MKKIIMLVILAMTVVGCELLDPAGWEKASEYRRERGRRCYKYPSGYIHCEDTK